ncbi:MAG: class B sortase [Lachnospiraceae bacterium]|nr:class B sortase [Lachnospiraceae bacterium]
MKGNKKILVIGILSLAAVLFAAVNLIRYYGGWSSQNKISEDLYAIRGNIAFSEGEAKGTEQIPLRKKSVEADAGAGKTLEELQTLYPDVEFFTSGQLSDLDDEMRQINDNYCFFLTIPGTKIDYPVVQLDNAFYLDHDFYGKKNARGTVFLDAGCSSEDENLLLHGHHMKDGTMFAALAGFTKEDFRGKHKIAVVYRKDRMELYTFFAAATVDLTKEDSFLYEKLPKSDVERMDYLAALKENAFWYEEPGKDPEGMLVLSTCSYGSDDERLVVYAVRN